MLQTMAVAGRLWRGGEENSAIIIMPFQYKYKNHLNGKFNKEEGVKSNNLKILQIPKVQFVCDSEAEERQRDGV